MIRANYWVNDERWYLKKEREMSSNKTSNQRHMSSGSVGGGHHNNHHHNHYPTSQLSYQETLIEEEASSPNNTSHHHNRSYSSNQHHSVIQSGYVLNQDTTGKDPKRHSLLLSNRKHSKHSSQSSDLLFTNFLAPHITDGIGWCGYILLFLSYALIFFTVPFSLTICLKVSP